MFDVNFTLPEVLKEFEKLKLKTPEIIARKFSFLFYPAILYGFCRILRPSVVIETGTGAGLGSSFILAALEANNGGQLYTIDMGGSKYKSEKYEVVDDSIWTHGREIGWAIPRHLRQRVKIIVGTSKKILPNLLPKVKKVDLFFHDSEHTYKNMMFEYECVWLYLRKGGILASHDIDWNNAFVDFCKK